MYWFFLLLFFPEGGAKESQNNIPSPSSELVTFINTFFRNRYDILSALWAGCRQLFALFLCTSVDVLRDKPTGLKIALLQRRFSRHALKEP